MASWPYSQYQIHALMLQRREIACSPQHIQIVLVGFMCIAGEEPLATNDFGGHKWIGFVQYNQIDARTVEKVFERNRQANLIRYLPKHARCRACADVDIRPARR